MDRAQLYKDIAQRTGGDIYVGVVGPVRTGKSTFIKKCMDMMFLPNIDNEHEKQRIIDELPQSAGGKTIMTTQPKFVPNEAAEIAIGDEGITARLRMIDCVGYMIPDAIGHMDGEAPRMVRTPWFDYDIPFEKAADIGTKKVINDHSTVGIIVTTDGTITQLSHSSYSEAEDRVINEMRMQGKPFLVIVNSTAPDAQPARDIAQNIHDKYGCAAYAYDVMNMNATDLFNAFEALLLEFPLKSAHISLPKWMTHLPAEHWLIERLVTPIKAKISDMRKMRDYKLLCEMLEDVEGFDKLNIRNVDMGSGCVEAELRPLECLFYNVLSEECGVEIEDDAKLFESVKALSKTQSLYNKIEYTLENANRTGYGIVLPDYCDMSLEEPEIVRQGNKFGVKLRAKASGMHMIRVDMLAEISPLVGTEEQSEEFLNYLTETFEKAPAKMWETNIFGKSLSDLVRESMANKAGKLPARSQERIQSTIQRMVNEEHENLICILL